MFNPEDFNLPLEKELRLQVITKEVDECTDIETLKVHLKTCAESLMRYQHLLGKAVEANFLNSMGQFIDTIKGEVQAETNGDERSA